MDATKEKGLFRHVGETLIGKQGRKAAFAIWGFWVANALIIDGKIDSGVWWKVFLTCALLIGFGTILDSAIEKFADVVATSAGTKVASVVKEKVDVAVSTENVQS